MPKKTWNIMVDGQNVEVKAEFRRDQRVWVNDQKVMDQRSPAFFGAKDYQFSLNGHLAFIRVTPGFIRNSLDLIIDGVSAETGKLTDELRPMAAWGWIFVLACGVMIVFGGAIPFAIAFGSASSVYSVMRNPNYSNLQRLVLSSTITIGAWLLLLILVGVVATLL